MRTKGAAWERSAERYLARRGLRPLARNVHSRFGEIDLVMTDGDCLVFVEVRYRARAGHGGAGASVTRHKQARLARAAANWLGRHPRWAARRCRFDVVAVDGAREPRINWIRGAFDAPGR